MVYCNQLDKPFKTAYGPRLKPWQWNKVKFRYDQKNLTVTVNGVSGKPVSASGYFRYPRATVLGSSERGEFFTGKIRDFKITPR